MTNHCCSTDPCHEERLTKQNGVDSPSDGNSLETHSLNCSLSSSSSSRTESSSSNSELLTTTTDECSSSTISMTVKSGEVDPTLNSHKSVRFADDCGLELATVRVMTEPSDYPPTINPSVLRRLLGKDATKDSNETLQSSGNWVVGFKQPASEYVKFRETLEKGMVALENVMLKNDICHMVGTVKVRNIAFEKRVFIRMTSDGWKSFADRAATFQPSSSKTYDTFSFDLEIPSNYNRPDATIEFCVCFETGPNDDESKRVQYWDSNGGKNYELRSEEQEVKQAEKVTPLFGKSYTTNDPYVCDYDNWTKFASWKNLSTEGPYW